MQSTFQALVRWSVQEFSELPWRAPGRDLYSTLVSEFMLQQTTVATVLKRFHAFLDRFPDLASLAQASEEEVLLAWQGLGYYARARRLHQAACALHQAGGIEANLHRLEELPGIGNYTACALLAIGADRPAFALDANLRRVLARFLGLAEEDEKALRQTLASAPWQALLQNLKPRQVNEALMDLGRTHCSARQTLCHTCPLAPACATASAQAADASLASSAKTPAKKAQALAQSAPTSADGAKNTAKNAKTNLRLLRLLCRDAEGRLLVYQKEPGEWLQGQWELPTLTLEVDETPFRQYPPLPPGITLAPLPAQALRSAITRYAISNFPLVLDPDQVALLAPQLAKRHTAWVHPAAPGLHLSSTSLKIMQGLGASAPLRN